MTKPPIQVGDEVHDTREGKARRVVVLAMWPDDEYDGGVKALVQDAPCHVCGHSPRSSYTLAISYLSPAPPLILPGRGEKGCGCTRGGA